jgi:glycine oxidase
MIHIIGGGIIGLSIAWRLVQRGFEVVVRNAGNRGGEASPAGAGMLAPGGEFVGPSVWTELGLESHSLYPAFIEELAAESGCAIDYRICGAIELAFSDQERAALRDRAQRQLSAGIACSETAEGVYYPNEGYVDPRQVLIALRTACNRRGVSIEDGQRISEIDGADFEALVIAAGAWSGDLAIAARGRQLPLPKTIPVKGHLIGFGLAAGSLPSMRRHGHTYLLQRANGFTIAGSNEERIGFDSRVDPKLCRELHADAAELWPELKSHTPSECWIGFRPATEDLLPKIGRFEDTNVWLAYGHYRNGILLAPLTAERIAGGVTSSLGRD